MLKTRLFSKINQIFVHFVANELLSKNESQSIENKREAKREVKNFHGSRPPILQIELLADEVSVLGQKRQRPALTPLNSPLSMMTEQTPSLVGFFGMNDFSAPLLKNELTGAS